MNGDLDRILSSIRALLSVLETAAKSDWQPRTSEPATLSPPVARPGKHERGVFAKPFVHGKEEFNVYRSDGVRIAWVVYPEYRDKRSRKEVVRDLWSRLDSEDPVTPLEESAALELALANLEAGTRLPEEPRVHKLLEPVLGQAEADRLFRNLWTQRRRIQQRYNEELRLRGKNCADCRQHFVPKRVDGIRCAECIARRKGTR
jgi:predicted Zn-ribbon and HTH transcriptional regulator